MDNEIYFEELYSKVNSFYLIDIRSPEEIMNSGKLPGAVNIPLNDIEEALNTNETRFYEKYNFPYFPKTEGKIVLYCRSGRRAIIAKEIFNKFGFTKLRLYKGSFQDWTANGGPVERTV